MKMKLVSQKITNTFGRCALKVKKYSPEILLISGVAFGAIGVVTACIKSTKAPDIINRVSDESNELEERIAHTKEKHIDYPKKEQIRDLTKIYSKAAKDFAKLYAVPATLLTFSGACIFSSYGIMKKRNIGLMAAYSALEKSYETLKQNIKEEFGEEKLEELKSKSIKEEAEITDNGTDTPSIKRRITGLDGYSPYARFFDEFSRFHTDDYQYNKVFLRTQHAYFENLLQTRGHVFLNEVYDALDIPRSSAGAVVGWLKNGEGDGHIDFGLDMKNDNVRDFMAGLNPSILLDFNVDGVIYDKI